MLKITVFSTAGGVTVKLEGELSGPSIAELESCWDVLYATAGRRPVCLDLTDVGYVSPMAKTVLGVMAREGAVILGPEGRRAGGLRTGEPLTSKNSRDTRSFGHLDGPRAENSQRGRATYQSGPWPLAPGPGQLSMPMKCAVALSLLAIVAIMLGYAIAALGSATVAKVLLVLLLSLSAALFISSLQPSSP